MSFRRRLVHGPDLAALVGGLGLAPRLCSALPELGLWGVILLAGFEFLYLGAYYCGNSGTCLAGIPGAPLWIPDALLLSALLLTPRRRWWVYLLAMLPIRLVPQLGSANLSVWLLLTNYLNDACKGIVSATFLQRFAGGKACFSSVRGYVLYLGCAVFTVPALSALGGAAVLHSLSVDYGVAWRNWFLGDALANLVVTPTIVLWLTTGLERLRDASHARYAEAILLATGLLVAGQMVFASRAMERYELTLLYVPIPFLLWAALRFGPLGASSALCLTATLAIWGAVHNLGPFSSLSPSETILSMQLFLGVLGVPLLFLGALIQERQTAFRALRESEGRYRAFFELNAVGAGEVDLAGGHFLRVNDALCQMTGYSRDELLQMRFSDITHPDDLADDWEQFQQVLRGEIPDYRMEKRYVRKGGSIIWVQLAVTLIKDGARHPVSELGLSQDITSRKRAEQELLRLSGRLLRVQDEERRRIAEELHEETAQSLVASNLNLADLLQTNAGLDDEARSRVRESIEMGEQALGDIRTLSYVLHPPLLDELGLTSALAWYVEGFSKRSGITVELTLLPDLHRLPSEVEAALYRVVQESLTNIHRHAGSERASIRLAREDGRIILEVMDQGRGMVAEGSGSSKHVESLGIGIAGMRERIRQLGGQLDISSSQTGTTVTAVVPSDGAISHE